MNNENEKKYSVSQLKKYCYEMFKVEKFVCDGAFNGLDGEYTKEEARQMIDKFLNKKL